MAKGSEVIQPMFRMKWILRFFSLIFAFCLAAGLLMAQGSQAARSSPPGNLTTEFEMNKLNLRSSRYHVVAGKVMTIDQDIVRGAEVRVSPGLNGDSRFFKTDVNGEFQTVYNMKGAFTGDFRVWLTIKKHGYQTAHELIDYADFPKPVLLPLTLRPEEPDPGLLSQPDLLSDLLPRLRSLGPADGLAARSEKKYAKGVQEFIEKKRPDRSLSDFADVAGHNPECARCLTMLALAELDSGNWDGATRRVDAAIKLTTRKKNPTGGSLEAVVLAGVMRSWMHAPQAAIGYFAYANRREPGNKLVLQELGRAYWQLHEYEQAEAWLKSSVAAGGGQDAYLLWIQVLLGEYKVDAANTEMNRFLNGRAVKKMPIKVRQVWAAVQNGRQVEALYAKTHKGRRRKQERGAAASIDFLHDSPRQMNLKGLEPAKNQDDLKEILAAAGKNVAALYHGFQNSISLEKVRQQQLRHNGKVSNEAVEKFRYLCLMPHDPHVPGFTEYRKSANPAWEGGSVLKGGYMLTSGFVSAALIFFPDYQAGSEFRYLGRQTVDDHQTYVVAFAQIPMKAALVGRFTIGKHSAPTFQQGLAWIDTKNYQIVRLLTDLLKPLPEVRLSKEAIRIDYQEVYFKQLAQTLWLPKDVTVTVVWRGKTLRNDHQYSDFKLFNVGAAEEITKRKTPKPITDPQTAHP
jgi:tetratricopeptide (TPR) repeat protein